MPRRLFAISIIARLPGPMLSIGLLVHAERITGSFAAAGVVAAVFAAALGVGGPLLARTADRRGQTAVLLGSAAVAGSALAAAAVLPVGAPPAALVAVAAALGLSVPPVGACLRALLPGLVDDAAAAYAAEATASELTFIAGPPLVLLAGTVWTTGIALAGAGALLVAGTVAFAAQGPSRAWRGEPRGRGGSLAAPGVRTLVFVFVAVGVVFGAVEVGVAAAASSAAGPLLGIWGAGSLAAGWWPPASAPPASGSCWPRWRSPTWRWLPPAASSLSRWCCASPARPSLPPTRRSTPWSSGSRRPAPSPRRSRG